MEDLILELYKRKIYFECYDNEVILGKYDTGFYGVVNTSIRYDGEIFHLTYGHRGYPLYESFEKVDDVIRFIEDLI